MQIICVSRGSLSQGKEFAEILAAKLGYECLGREDLQREAVRAGIAVDHLEASMFRGSIFSERWELEKEHYKALLTTILCERASKGNIVYHGLTGHLLLPGISHVLRIRVVTDMEYRINVVIKEHNLDRRKAIDFITRVEEDRRRWARVFYGVEWDASSHYDVILNLEKMSPENAASATCQVAALPDFQPTPASIRVMENLLLASRCRVALARNNLTNNTALKVQANDGGVAVTYMPQSAKVADLIPEVIREVKGVRELVCTMARTNILWIQERFDPASPYFSSICAVADKWDAAVELLRIRPQPEKEQEERPEETEQAGEQDTGGTRETIAELIKRGRAGGARSVGRRKLEVLGAIDRSVPYSLIVVGDIFLSKGHVARMRLARELSGFLFDQLKRPVVMAEELASRYLFGPRQWLNLFLFLAVSGALYLGVFSFQEEVLLFLQAEGIRARALAVIAVLLFVPTIAFCYGSSARLVLKLIKME